jgi:site-specific DNA recombinase
MKKQALGYVRISTKDQSHFSLDGQEEAIRKHCERQGWDILGITREEQSGKNFDRVNWKQMETYVKQNHKQIDYLVVAKYDRFSRNVSEALAMLDKLEKKYNIRVMSVMEPIGMHPQSPYFFQFRTQMLVGAEMELRVIKDRTKFGLVQAASSGRHTHTAPFGYKNARDEGNKPILVIDENRCELVREAYKLYTDGIGMAEIQRLLKPKGLKMNGNSAMHRMLTNPLYTGLIRVPAYYDDPERIVEAKNEPIIDRATWYKAQSLVSGKSITRTVYNEDVPLRGSLLCHCGRCLTAGNSKGKNKYYWYYKCPAHKENLSASRLHGQFAEMLKELSLPKHYIDYLLKRSEQQINEKMEANTAHIRERRKELDSLLVNIDELEEKYLTDRITEDTYSKWCSRWNTERYAIQDAIDKLQVPQDSIWKRYNECMPMLGDVHYLYQKGDIHHKQAFVKVVFNSQLYYQGSSYRTPYILPVFGLKAAPLKEKGLLIVEQPIVKSGETPVCSEGGS